MTRDELRKRLLTILSLLIQTADGDCYIEDSDIEDAVTEILTLFKGWKSPEEVQSICEAYFHTLYGHSMKEVSEMMKEGQ